MCIRDRKKSTKSSRNSKKPIGFSASQNSSRGQKIRYTIKTKVNAYLRGYTGTSCTTQGKARDAQKTNSTLDPTYPANAGRTHRQNYSDNLKSLNGNRQTKKRKITN